LTEFYPPKNPYLPKRGVFTVVEMYVVDYAGGKYEIVMKEKEE
jgi:hypothetical protein